MCMALNRLANILRGLLGSKNQITDRRQQQGDGDNSVNIHVP